MTTETVMSIEPEVDELQQLQTVVAMHEAKVTSLQDELQGVEALLVQSHELATSLKVKISEGDSEAGRQLDALEREQRDLLRRQDGLNLRLRVQQADLIPLTTRASELARERDRCRQDEFVAKASKRCDELITEILELQGEACEYAYQLISILQGDHRELDAEHKTAILQKATDVGNRLNAASVIFVNEANRFEFFHSQLFRKLEIIPAHRKSAG